VFTFDDMTIKFVEFVLRELQCLFSSRKLERISARYLLVDVRLCLPRGLQKIAYVFKRTFKILERRFMLEFHGPFCRLSMSS
jgi:hypothetical protein